MKAAATTATTAPVAAATATCPTPPSTSCVVEGEPRPHHHDSPPITEPRPRRLESRRPILPPTSE
jgi:hypothetical protein